MAKHHNYSVRHEMTINIGDYGRGWGWLAVASDHRVIGSYYL